MDTVCEYHEGFIVGPDKSAEYSQDQELWRLLLKTLGQHGVESVCLADVEGWEVNIGKL